MKIHARGRLPIPEHFQPHLGAPNPVIHLIVAVVVELVAVNVRGKFGRKSLRAGDLPELGRRDRGRPTLAALNLDVLADN